MDTRSARRRSGRCTGAWGEPSVLSDRSMVIVSDEWIVLVHERREVSLKITATIASVAAAGGQRHVTVSGSLTESPAGTAG